MRLRKGAGVAALAVVFALSVCCDAAQEKRVRASALAGSWYPAERGRLRDAIDNFCGEAPDAKLKGRLVALIAPHAGYTWSGRVAGYAYRQVKRDAVKRVILLGPSHYAGFRGFSIASADVWRTPLGEVAVDGAVCEKLRAHRLHVANDAWQKPEHSLEIELPFLQRTAGDFTLVPILVGQLRAGDAEAIAAAIKPFVTKDTLIVVSSDFTHYGPRFQYVPFEKNPAENIRKLDMGAVELILKKDFDGYMAYLKDTQVTICGRYAIAIMLKLLPEDAHGKLLKYDTSGRMSGDYGNSVSYVAAVFTTGDKGMPAERTARLTEKEEKILLRIARTTLNTTIKSARVPKGFEKLYEMTPALKAKSGVFVTLKKNGRLRGCIGRIGYPEVAEKLPPLYECVRLMTVQSAQHDPRFPAVEANELEDIRIEISVLTIAQEVAGPKDFKVGRDGIIIRKGFRGAVFLPQVAPEQGWDRATTLSHLCVKAGLPADEWKKPGMRFFTFRAQVFDESLIRKDLPGQEELIR